MGAAEGICVASPTFVELIDWFVSFGGTSYSRLVTVGSWSTGR